MLSSLASQDEVLGIYLLGGFNVRVGPRLIPESAWRLRKAKSLVKLLALAPNHRLHCEQIREIFWPEFELTAAAHNFHQAVYIARRTLDPAGSSPPLYLRLQNDILTLCNEESLWVDVEAFMAAADQAHRGQDVAAYRPPLDLYTGDLLPGDRYEDWANSRRETLRQEFFSLLIELAQLYEASRDYEPAIETLRRALEKDPAHEEAHRGLMRLYALTGRRQQALRQYRILCEALREELEADPDPESQRLHQDILAGRPLSPDAPEAQPARIVAQVSPGQVSLSPKHSVPRPETHLNHLPVPLAGTSNVVGNGKRELDEVEAALAAQAEVCETCLLVAQVKAGLGQMEEKLARLDRLRQHLAEAWEKLARQQAAQLAGTINGSFTFRMRQPRDN